MSFDNNLKMGQIGESLIARWLRRRGNWVLPVYEKEINNGKGPRLFLPVGQLIAPDLLVMGPCVQWIEAKHKTAFTWHRNTGRWTTGIDLVHYRDYLRVNDESPYEVWLLFLHQGGQAKDSPPNSPAGLYGGSLGRLRNCENHRHGNWGKGGMVYWAKEDLAKLAELDEVLAASRTHETIVEEARR